MNEKSQHHRDGVFPAQDVSPSAPPAEHPVWCDPTLCTADPASQANGYRPGAGGEHPSVPIPLTLTTAMWLPVRDGTAWLTVACAPWPCDAFLRVQVGDVELSLPAEDARRVLDALSTLLASATSVGEVAE